MSIILRAQISSRFVASQAWNLLFPKGTWHGENLRPIGGSITIDDAMLAEMVANWRDAGSPPLPVYKTHAHLDDDATALERAELSKAYGYLTDFRVTAQGLEAKTEWTPAGKAMVDAGEFAFWSPEWQPKHRDRRTGEVKGWWLSATALCSNPFFDTMPQLAAHEMPPVAASADDAETTDPTPQHRSTTMNEEQLKQLRANLGLAADATIEACLEASKDVGPLKASASADAEKLTAAVKAKDDTETKLAASLDEVKALKASLVERDVDALIATGKAAGKALDPMREFILEAAQSGGVEKAQKLIASVPAVVPVKAEGVAVVVEQPVSIEGAVKQFEALVDEQIKAGASASQAYRIVASANRELAAKAFPSTSSTR